MSRCLGINLYHRHFECRPGFHKQCSPKTRIHQVFACGFSFYRLAFSGRYFTTFIQEYTFPRCLTFGKHPDIKHFMHVLRLADVRVVDLFRIIPGKHQQRRNQKERLRPVSVVLLYLC